MKKIVKRAGLISGIILSAFVIGGCGKTVDLNDCVEVKVSGIDGKGKAEVTVDYDKMETLLAKELNIEVKDKDIENIEDLGSAVDGGLDKQGRVLISSALRNFAHLEKEVVLVGVLDRVEIWDKAKWEENNTVIEDNMDDIASHMEELGLGI